MDLTEKITIISGLLVILLITIVSVIETYSYDYNCLGKIAIPYCNKNNMDFNSVKAGFGFKAFFVCDNLVTLDPRVNGGESYRLDHKTYFFTEQEVKQCKKIW